jgi:hypothetical protein
MELTIYLGIISPTKIIIAGIIYLFLTLPALFLVLKNEKTLFVFIWILVILFFPYLGSILYLLKHFLNKNSAHNIV